MMTSSQPVGLIESDSKDLQVVYDDVGMDCSNRDLGWEK